MSIMLSRRWKTKSCSIAVNRNSNSLPASTLKERSSPRRPSFLTLRDRAARRQEQEKEAIGFGTEIAGHNALKK